jgi:hypothetical protein
MYPCTYGSTYFKAVQAGGTAVLVPVLYLTRTDSQLASGGSYCSNRAIAAAVVLVLLVVVVVVVVE